MEGSLSEVQYISSWDLSAGEFFDRNEVDIIEKGASLTSNVVHLYGKVRPRPGLLRLNAPSPEANPVTHLGQFLPLLQPTSNLIATFQNGTALEVYEYNGGWNSISGGPLLGIAASGIYPQSVNFVGNLYIIPGDGDMLVYGPANPLLTSVASLQGVASLQPPVRPRLLAVAPDRLFLANVIDPVSGDRVPWRLHWSDHLTPEIWGYGVGAGTANFVDLAEDNEPITALHTYSDTITVFKPRIIYTGKFVGGQEILDFRILADGPGCVSHRTLTRYRDAKFIFLGDEDVYMARPGELPQPIGGPITQRIRDIVDLPNISKAVAFCDIDNELYWLFLPKAGTSETRIIFVCNLLNGAWFEGEFALSGDITSVYAFREGPWGTKLVVGDSEGFVHEFTFQAPDDNGAVFSAFWESGLISVERISESKALDCTILEARCFSDTDGGRVNITVTTSDGIDEADITNFGEQRFGGVVEEDHYKTERAGALSGEFFKFRFSFPSIVEAAFIQGIQVGIIFGGGPSRS